MRCPARLLGPLAALALLGACLACPAAAETLGPDLVANGSFETGDDGRQGWTWGTRDADRTSVAADDTVHHSGRRSLRLHSALPFAPHVYCGLSQSVGGLAPDTEYLIRLWAKGKGVGNCWFGGGPEWLARRSLPSGDYDWTLVELRWRAPENPTSFELRLNVDSETEALWVDDVTFQEVNPLGVQPRVRALSPEAAVRLGYLLLAPLPHAPRLDGDLGDWPQTALATRIPADAGVVALDRKGDDDLSATLRAGADKTSLYLGIAVRDDTHWAPPEAIAWTNDSLQLAFDPLHERTPGGYGPHDSEYSLMLGGDGKPHVQCWQSPQGLGDRSRAIALAVRRSGAETVYEVAIPWSALGVRIGPGGPVLGLNVLINDNDGSGRRGYVELTAGIGRVKDPAAYVTALDTAARSVAVLPAKPLVYEGDTVDLKAVVVLGTPLSGEAGVELAALDAKGNATTLTTTALPAGTGGIVQLASRLPADRLPASTTRLQARVTGATGEQFAVGTAALQVSDLKDRLTLQAAQLRERTAQVVRLAEEAERRGLATDYERVGLTVAQEFVGYALDDLAGDRPARAEHVLSVVDRTLSDVAQRLRAYLGGRATPLLVPRFVTSRVEVKRGAFWADTLVPSTGRRERRPVFFVGYGHFPTVVRDLPKLPALGASIIQIECGPNSTQPAEGVVTDQPVRDYVGRALSLGEQNNVMVCWLASPHYFPGWALAKWPDLQKGGGGFFGLAVDAPQAHDIFRTHLTVSLGAIKDSPALHSVCLSNEPTFTNWQADPFRRTAFTAHLAGKFGAIGKLNAAWGTSYADFAEVPILPTESLPGEDGMTPLRYELARFNMDAFAAYHRFMSDTVHAAAPGLPTHAKVMCLPVSRQNLAWGCDPEQFAYLGDLNGNDCSCMFAGLGDQYAVSALGQNAYYDLQRSLREVPVFNTEDHIIVDREQRLIPPEHTDFALWQGALHGRGASTIWVWERTYDRTHDFEGSIMHRPENVMAVGKVGLDLQRLAPEVVKLQRARAPIAILYSLTAQLWSDRAVGAMLRAYEALNTCGVPVRFVSEKQAAAGRLKGFRAVIAPEVRHAPDSLVAAVAAYCRGGGELWTIGSEAPFGRDEYNRPRTVDLPAGAVRQLPADTTPRELWTLLLRRMAERGLATPVAVRGANGAPLWGLEYRAVRDGDGLLVAVANLWGRPQTAYLAVDGVQVAGLHDLRSDRRLPGDHLTLKPLEATILRVTPARR